MGKQFSPLIILSLKLNVTDCERDLWVLVLSDGTWHEQVYSAESGLELGSGFNEEQIKLMNQRNRQIRLQEVHQASYGVCFYILESSLRIRFEIVRKCPMSYSHQKITKTTIR